MKKLVFIGLLTLILGFQAAKSQPGWSVNAADYQYSATITGDITIAGNEFRNTGGIIGAFYNGVCRGVASPQLVVSLDKYLVFMTVYSNVATGEDLTFKFYNNEIDFIHDVNNTLSFVVNLTLGTMASPYLFEVAPANSSTILSITPGYADVVKALSYDMITVAYATTTSQLNSGLTAPKDNGGNVVGSFVIRYVSNGLAVPLNTTEVTDQMEVLVTAQNLDERVYSIFLGNADAKLSGIAVSQGTLNPAFDPTTLYYVLKLPFGASTPTVSATLSDPNATKIVTQAGSIPGVATVGVTAEDGVTTSTYQISISYNSNTDATLKELTVSSGTLAPGFLSSVLVYTVDLPWGTSTVPGITAKATDGNATVQVTPPASLPGSATIVVTAEDLTSAKTYRIDFNYLPGDDATLSSLSVSDGSLEPAFNPAVTAYDLKLTYGASAPIVAATLTDGNASKVITQAASVPGTASVVVTAQDGVTTKTYQISVLYKANTDATLKSLTLAAASLKPGFSPSVLSYAVDLPWGTSAAPGMIALPTDANAAVKVTLPGSLPGIATILVTAEDMTTTSTYQIQYNILPNTNARLQSLVPLAGSLSPAFDPDITSYMAYCPIGTASVSVVAIAQDAANASVEIQYPSSLPGEVRVSVTAMDETTVMQYSIQVQWEGSTDPSLSNLSINNAPLEGFDPDVRSYDYVMPEGMHGMPSITAVTADDGASYEVDMPASIPGNVVVRVYAENYNIFRTYQVHLLPNLKDATLWKILVDTSALEGFDPFVTNYSVALASGTATVPVVSVSTTNPAATVTVTQAPSVTGKAVVTVSSADNTMTRSYEVQFSVSTGIGQATWNAADLKAYPNPSNGNVTVEFALPAPEALVISLMNLQGQVVFEKALSSGVRFTESLSFGVSPGMYLLKVRGVSDVMIQKLLIE